MSDIFKFHLLIKKKYLSDLPADGMTYSFGIFYDEFLGYFKEGKGYTAWIASILVGVTLCSGKCPPKKLATHFPTYVKAHFFVVGAALFGKSRESPTKRGVVTVKAYCFLFARRARAV